MDDDGQIAAPSSFKVAHALIDTCADHIYIDKDFANACGLREIDRTTAIGASGVFETPTFFGRIQVPDLAIEKDLRMIGMALRGPGSSAQAVIIGRYFLNTFGIVFTYDAGAGAFTLDPSSADD